MVGAFDQHAAAAAGWVVHAVAGLGVDQLHHQLHHGFGGVELAALFAGIVGKLLDEVFVGITQHVGFVEVGIAQAVLVEVAQQALQGRITEDAFVAVLGGGEHVLQLGVVGFDGGEGFVQRLANGLGAGDQAGPAGIRRERAPFVLHLVFSLRFGQVFVFFGGKNAFVKHVVEALQKEQAEDVVFEIGRVDGAAQNVGGLPEPALQGIKGQGVGHGFSVRGSDQTRRSASGIVPARRRCLRPGFMHEIGL